jgi:hypothetical protein
MTQGTPDLHLFLLCDCDFVAAKDLDDAWAAYCEETGNKRSDFEDPGEAIADDKCIAVAEHEGRGAPKTTKTAREWAQYNGRGLAFSTEY